MRKKWLTAILAVLMAMSCSACVKNPQVTPTTESQTAPSEGISIKVMKAEIQKEETILQVQWKNETEYSIMYGEMFGLQKWVEGQWVDCPMNENTGFIAIGYMLQPGKTITKSYTLRWAFGDLEAGRYRFLTSCSVEVGYSYQEHKLSADFTLGEEASPIVFEQPPKLWLVHSGKELATNGNYTWNYELEDGMWACVNADSSHPLCLKEDLSMITPETLNLILDFEKQPDGYTIRCWPDSADVNDEGETITSQYDRIELKIGAHIYAVTATWNDDGKGFYGTVSYVFYAAPTVIPITEEATLYIAGESVSLNEQQAKIVSDLLSNLPYDQNLICNCQPEYEVLLPNGKKYGIHLEEAYVRCDEGQCKLNDDQLDALTAIIDWALEQTKAR